MQSACFSDRAITEKSDTRSTLNKIRSIKAVQPSGSDEERIKYKRTEVEVGPWVPYG